MLYLVFISKREKVCLLLSFYTFYLTEIHEQYILSGIKECNFVTIKKNETTIPFLLFKL